MRETETDGGIVQQYFRVTFEGLGIAVFSILTAGLVMVLFFGV